MNAEYYEILAQHLALIERQHKKELRLIRQLNRNEVKRYKAEPIQRPQVGLRLVHSRD